MICDACSVSQDLIALLGQVDYTGRLWVSNLSETQLLKLYDSHTFFLNPFLILMLLESRQAFLGMNLILSSLDYVFFFFFYNLESQRKTLYNLVCYVNKQPSVRGYDHRSPRELDSYKAFGRKHNSILGSQCFHIYWILDIPKSSKRDQIIFN